MFGRLFAVADIVEQGVLDVKEKENAQQAPGSNNKLDKRRATNARRYMATFAQRPATTWKNIYLRLLPYLRQSRAQFKAQKEFDQIMGLMGKDAMVDQPLDGTFLLGYSHQRNAWFKKATENEEEK